MLRTLILLAAVATCQAQLTAQSSVAPDLRQCYLDPQLLNRNNLPPTTIQTLIDIIRKIEDNPNVNMDLRTLSALLLHTYRQDGIEYHQPETIMAASSNVLPYAPTFHSFHRHRLMLMKLIPSNLQVLANDTVNPTLTCALHHMLSTTIDARVRGDEGSCNQLSQYRALRTVRSIDEDVEVLNTAELNSALKSGQMRHYNPNNDVEFTRYGGEKFEKQLLGESTCPLLDGVVFTEWGAVSAGNVIAGIAAGAQLQQVPVLELAKGSVLNYDNIQPYVTSIYPATLSGDLAEAVLIQGTERGSAAIMVGTSGNWNSTQAPRHYMLHSRTNVEMTDPEIRGDIDGFILGSTLTNTMSSFSNLRLSTLLDMYYSPRSGVLNTELRACNRRALSQQYLTNVNLESETLAFAAGLDTNFPLRGTIIGGLDALVSSAVSNFQTYTTSNLNDMSCATSEATSSDSRLRTNLYIALDFTWQFAAAYPAISHLLDSIEVNKYGSSITLLNAFDGSIVVNTTYSLADFHTNYTLAVHQSVPQGVNLQTSLTNIRTMAQENLRTEALRNYVGGNSTVVLYLINSGNLQVNSEVFEQARQINDTVPDLRLLFATSTNQFDNIWSLVRDMHNDIMTVALTSTGTNVEITMSNIVQRIQQVGRRIINPLCGAEFTAGPSGTRQFDDYIEPGFINFYAISPNYFFGEHENRRLRITRSSSSSGNFIVCHSRVVAQPRQNATQTVAGQDVNAVTCQTLVSGNVEIGLQNMCSDYWTINTCPPLYVSVQSEGSTSAVSTASCTDVAHCRFPYNIRYQVQIEDFGCFSGAGGFGASLAFVVFAYLLTVIRNI